MPPGVQRFSLPLFLMALSTTAMSTAAPSVDVLSLLTEAREARLGDGTFSMKSVPIADQLLSHSSSPYSEEESQPAFTNDVEWVDILDTLPASMSEADALETLRIDLGATRARPGVDVEPSPGFRDRFASASATKADVDADIFWHALDLMGYHHSARAAGYAVALQILRRQVETTPVERRAASGIDESVLRRFMLARNASDLRPDDVTYLGVILRFHVSHGMSGEFSRAGKRLIPARYRIARVAAAYRDLEGYIAPPPCRPDGSPASNQLSNDDTTSLCFVAAHDRAVYQWYQDEIRRQGAPSAYIGRRKASPLLMLFMAIAPVIDMLALAEGLEFAAGEEVAIAAEEDTLSTVTEASPCTLLP